jgi:hypothetical protein
MQSIYSSAPSASLRAKEFSRRGYEYAEKNDNEIVILNITTCLNDC